ncbi:MAG: ClpX C4-type zinc finger protein, partial [Lachnospiraceae bacterium]|nr:ClpX C4-type zinc finger protein [Lachnospiraceae bacterium]
MADNNDIKDTDTTSGNRENETHYEEYCSMCHRPESVCGRLIRVPNSVNICMDCMQKTFDGMANMGFPGVFGPDIDFGDLFPNNSRG